MKPKALLQTLTGALYARQASLRNGRCHRKDIVALRAAMGRVEVFLRSYPFATDERVKGWCRDHEADVRIVVPGNMPGVLMGLMAEKEAAHDDDGKGFERVELVEP